MKQLFYTIVLLCSFEASGQQISLFFYSDEIKKDTSDQEALAVRRNTKRNDCGCLAPFMWKFDEEGHPLLRESHPDAKYFNDPKHWYWQHVSDDPRLGGYWEIKPEYEDSIPDGAGGWLKAPYWIVAHWREEEPEPEPELPVEEYLKFGFPFLIPKNDNKN